MAYWKVSVDFYLDPTKYIAEGDTLPQPDSVEGADAVIGAALAGLCPVPHVEFTRTMQATWLPEPLVKAQARAAAERGKVIRFADYTKKEVH